MGFSVHRSDRTRELTGKSRGGGICLYINNSWCDERNLHCIKSFYSPDLEFHMLMCRPFWLPREFTAIIITAVYILPQANTDQALKELYGYISEQETVHPDAVFVVTGDFRTIAPKYFQHITINMRGDRVLDHCYSPFRDAYKSLPRPPFGKSDHSSVLLLPAYRQKLKARVFIDIFNLSLSLSVFPSCFKKSTIVPIPKENKITCLNDWRPVALTPIFSKCFEKLIRDHICSVLPASLDPLQFAYRSTDDTIAFTLHTALSHLENKNTYVRMLFVDYSSAFNTIVPATLVAKLQTLGLNRSLCSWILDFLTGRNQVVRKGNNTSSPLVLNTGALQGCILSPLLYSLYTHDCAATHSSNVIVKFANDTTVIGLITNNDETAYREEVITLTKWCQENHLSLNIDKTKVLVVDYRRQSREHTPITIDKIPVERVNSFKFLGVHITEDLTWSAHTDAVLKKAHQRLFFLRWLRKFGTSPVSLDPSTPALWRAS